MSEMTVVTVRDIDIVTAEINTIKVQTSRMIVANAIEIGRRLTEAKSMVEHGKWGSYLRERVDYSQSTANNLMRLFEEYGDKQESLFDSFKNSQAFGNLTYTKALRLLAIPEEERAEFAQEHDVEKLSTRELDKLIRERDAAKEAQRKAEQAAEASALQVQSAQEQAEALRDQARLADQARLEEQKKAEALQLELEKAQKAEREARERANRPADGKDMPEAVMKKLRQEARAQEAEKARKEVEEQLRLAEQKAAEAEKARDAARNAAAQAEEKLAAARKETSLSGADAATFRAVFEQVQLDFNRLQGVLIKVKTADDALGEKFETALLALLDKLRSAVRG